MGFASDLFVFYFSDVNGCRVLFMGRASTSVLERGDDSPLSVAKEFSTLIFLI